MSFKPDGWKLAPAWDAIAGDYETKDGWIKLHTNAPHHRAAVLAVLGVGAERDAVAAAARSWSGEALEAAVVERGGCAAYVPERRRLSRPHFPVAAGRPQMRLAAVLERMRSASHLRSADQSLYPCLGRGSGPPTEGTIAGLEPLSGVVQHRFPESRRRHYEHLRALPTGLIATGDAVCSFNPVYGQGMTVATIEAEALDLALTEAGRRGRLDLRFTRRWYRGIAAVIDVAWQGVAIEDFRFPELSHERPVRLRVFQWYMARVQSATHTDPDVTDRFYRVIGFLEPPAALLRPRMVARVLGFGGWA